jgi:hypothetical protein
MDRIDEATDAAPAGQAARRRARNDWSHQAAWLAAALAMLPACAGNQGSGTGGSGATGGDGSGGQGGGGSQATGGGGSGAQGGGGSQATGGAAQGGSGGIPAGIGTPCPFGTECPASAPACVSKGEGDATAYCSIHDCDADSDCPGGFYCGITRDPHELCGSNPPKGDNNQCGQTTEPCIDPATDPTSIFEGSICLLRRTCLYRGPCVPCVSDADCSGQTAQKCVLISGQSHCARACADDGDCLDDQSCSLGACLPKFGACTGTGQFCEPCIDDEDCGDASGSMGCAELSGGQRACFDFSFSTSCADDLDCPTSPSGKHGACLDESLGVDSSSSLYHRCYLPFDAVSNQFSCW